MYKKTMTYTDYDGVERTEDFYFNLNKAELMEMDFSESGGMEKMIRRVIEAKDTRKLIEIFKDLILRSYGEKSADGKYFEKVRDGRKLSDGFAQTEAYSDLFMELATNDEAATTFITNVIPKNLAEEIEKKKDSITDITKLT